MDSDDPQYASIADRNAADSLAGLVVAGEVQDQREAKLKSMGNAPAGFASTRPAAAPDIQRNRAAPPGRSGSPAAQPKTGTRESASANWPDAASLDDKPFDSGTGPAAQTRTLRPSDIESGETAPAGGIATAQYNPKDLEEDDLPAKLPDRKKVGWNERIPFDRRIYVNRSLQTRKISLDYAVPSPGGTGYVPFAHARVIVPHNAKVARTVAEYGFPLGVETFRQFVSVTAAATYGVRLALQRKFGRDTALSGRIGIRGSAVAGQKFVEKQGSEGDFFSEKSDIDLFIVNPALLEKWQEIEKGKGGRKRSGKNRSRPLSDGDLKSLGLYEAVLAVRAVTGRKNVTIKIFRDMAGPQRSGRAMAQPDSGDAAERKDFIETSVFVWDNRRLARELLSDPVRRRRFEERFGHFPGKKGR